MSDPTYRKPLPGAAALSDPITGPYWAHAKAHRLSLQACCACGHVQFPPGPVCSGCLSDDLQWQAVSGRGRLVSWIEMHRAYWPSYADDVPYNVAIVQLDEGPQIVSNLVGELAAPDAPLKQGLALQAVFDDVTPEVSLVRFQKAPAA